MPTDLERLFAALGQNVRSAALPGASAIRQRADRRARIVTATAAAVLVLGLGIGGALVITHGPGPTPVPGVGEARTPTAPPTHPTGIPDNAFYQPPSDRTGGAVIAAPGNYGFSMMPSWCQPTARDDTAVVEARLGRMFDMYRPGSPTTLQGELEQIIVVYRPGRAVDAMRQLRDDLAACQLRTPTATTGVDRFEVIASSLADESLVVKRTWVDPGRPPRNASYYAIVRVGDVVTVLVNTTYHGEDADLALTDETTPRAVAAIRAWLRP
jgi:hypothetical protein